MELPAGDGAPLLETDYPEPDEGSRLTPVGTLEHHGDLKASPMLTLDLETIYILGRLVVLRFCKMVSNI